ncbi:uncharacterized protein B0P05DRAFT_525457 [Gilbertella persicaria]|uniref:uncharacterized protein n=1 Tax=Gilbertella persicaria TaxID=101096 RepID=UPI0022206E12|nr:uncharacterized protein B0P05DRAFT_525457 [Gilbertella persicaria]KAI8092252.1 hypothetical protein B0P05DRAFT_525457 [Gilbertella persicaria]
MKFALVSLVASAALVSATPAGHFNLFKRAIIGTSTVVINGQTQLQLIDQVPEAIVTSTSTLFLNSAVVTTTSNSYICKLISLLTHS